jgi:hypothetical protein
MSKRLGRLAGYIFAGASLCAGGAGEQQHPEAFLGVLAGAALVRACREQGDELSTPQNAISITPGAADLRNQGELPANVMRLKS